MLLLLMLIRDMLFMKMRAIDHKVRMNGITQIEPSYGAKEIDQGIFINDSFDFWNSY
jgi:hypothetical protein